MNSINIRKAVLGDEKITAHIQAESWKSGFGSIISAEEMEKHTNIARIEEMHANVLENHIAEGLILTVDDRPHGIVFWSKAREEEDKGRAELICIHSLVDNWGKGYGSMMMERVLAEVKKAGYPEIILWVFEDNIRARRLYEKWGFVLSEEKKETCGAIELMYLKRLDTE